MEEGRGVSWNEHCRRKSVNRGKRAHRRCCTVPVGNCMTARRVNPWAAPSAQKRLHVRQEARHEAESFAVDDARTCCRKF